MRAVQSSSLLSSNRPQEGDPGFASLLVFYSPLVFLPLLFSVLTLLRSRLLLLVGPAGAAVLKTATAGWAGWAVK